MNISGEWQKALNFLEELDKESNLDLSISRNHYYCEIAESHIEIAKLIQPMIIF